MSRKGTWYFYGHISVKADTSYYDNQSARDRISPYKCYNIFVAYSQNQGKDYTYEEDDQTLLGTVLALAMIISVFSPFGVRTARADEAKETVHILYRTTDGELKALWKFEVKKDEGTDVPADLMTGYDPEGIIGTIEDQQVRQADCPQDGQG